MGNLRSKFEDKSFLRRVTNICIFLRRTVFKIPALSNVMSIVCIHVVSCWWKTFFVNFYLTKIIGVIWFKDFTYLRITSASFSLGFNTGLWNNGKMSESRTKSNFNSWTFFTYEKFCFELILAIEKSQLTTRLVFPLSTYIKVGTEIVLNVFPSLNEILC